ncbi:MAG: redoxin domain-containing protein [Pedosphaera sp.]|nr:redoxin domain-containing protein [Pedosphaera sp.]
MDFNLVRRIAPRVLIFSLLLQSLISVWAAAPRAIPDFALLDLQGCQFELHRAPGKAVVLFFTGVGCPIARKNARKLQSLSDQFRTNGISFWIINTYADDSVHAAQGEVMELNLRGLTYLRDPNQAVAQSLNVERTAEVVVVRLSDYKVLYQGAIDDQFTEGKERPTVLTPFLKTALKEFLAGQPVSVSRTASHGCRITFTTASEAEVPPD